MNTGIIPKPELMNAETGESIPLDTTTVRRPQRLKMNVWIEAYDFVIEKTVKTPLDFKMLSHIKKNVDAENQFIGSLSDIAIATGTTKATVSKFIKKLLWVGFLHRVRQSVYMVNPFVFIGDRVHNIGKTKGAIACQDRWSKLSMRPPKRSRDLWLHKTLIGEPTTEPTPTSTINKRIEE